jgi:hypothetical protein
LVIGLSLVLAAFVAGKIAGRDYVLHGALVRLVSLAIRLLIGGSAPWFSIVIVSLDIPLAILGALVARRTKGNLVVGKASGA